MSIPKFASRHYEAIAKVFADDMTKYNSHDVYRLQHSIANMLADDNPNFKSDKFHDACARKITS